MTFFKQTWLKGIIYASIFTLFPYIPASILGGWQRDGAWAEFGFRLVVIAGTPPLWLIKFTFPTYNLWDDFLFFYVNPIISFLVWYLVIYITTIFFRKLTARKSKSKKENTH